LKIEDYLTDSQIARLERNAGVAGFIAVSECVLLTVFVHGRQILDLYKLPSAEPLLCAHEGPPGIRRSGWILCNLFNEHEGMHANIIKTDTQITVYRAWCRDAAEEQLAARISQSVTNAIQSHTQPRLNDAQNRADLTRQLIDAMNAISLNPSVTWTRR
jgi:hypothetical protein